MSLDRHEKTKRKANHNLNVFPQTSILMLGVYFFTGMLLVLGQLLPGGTQQVAIGESLPQALLWLLVGALFATDHVLNRYASVQRRFLATNQAMPGIHLNRWPILLGAGLLVWILVATCNVYGHSNLRFAVNGCWQWFAWAVAILILSRIMIHPRIHRNVQWIMIALAWLV